MARNTYFDREIGEEISKEFMLPVQYCSCPGCGKLYGAYHRLVCEVCGECSKCCSCDEKDRSLVEPLKYIQETT